MSVGVGKGVCGVIGGTCSLEPGLQDKAGVVSVFVDVLWLFNSQRSDGTGLMTRPQMPLRGNFEDRDLGSFHAFVSLKNESLNYVTIPYPSSPPATPNI